MFRQEAQLVVVERDSKVVASLAAVDVGEPEGRAMFELANGDELTVSLDRDLARAVLERVRPSPETQDSLNSKFEDVLDSGGFYEAVAVGDLIIDGEPWGWLPDADHHAEWRPIPHSEEGAPFTFSAWMSKSMTGADMEAGIRAWGERAAIVYIVPDLGGASDRVAMLRYLVDDWDVLADETLKGLDRYFNPYCPLDDDGWEVEGHFASCCTTVGVGKALTHIWQPCEKHLTLCRSGDEVLEFGGQRWRWEQPHWIAD